MRNYTIGRIWGIPIRISISLIVFLPVLAWLIGGGEQIPIYADLITSLTGIGFDVASLRAGNTPWLIGIVAAVGLFVSVTIHELGHSWVALRYGLTIESITLWILGGIAALGELPREWNKEFWIAIAGPATSLAVAAVSYAGLLIIPDQLPIVRFIFGWLTISNVILAGFNLLPAFPMDGGRVLRALLSRSMPYASATRLAGRIGVVFAILFAVIGALSFNVIMLLLALFIYGAATTESRTVLLDEFLDGLTVGDVMSRDPPRIAADESVADLVNRMVRDRRTRYPVVDESGRPVGVVSLDDIKQVAVERRSTTTVGDVAHEVPTIAETTDAFDALVGLGRGSDAALVAVGGQLVGIISQDDYAHALQFRQGIGVALPI